MAFDQRTGLWILTQGELAYWVTEDRTPVRCKVELVTDERIYLRATASDGPKRTGQVWFEARYSRRVAPRDAVLIRKGKAYVDWAVVIIHTTS